MKQRTILQKPASWLSKPLMMPLLTSIKSSKISTKTRQASCSWSETTWLFGLLNWNKTEKNDWKIPFIQRENFSYYCIKISIYDYNDSFEKYLIKIRKYYESRLKILDERKKNGTWRINHESYNPIKSRQTSFTQKRTINGKTKNWVAWKTKCKVKFKCS